MNTPATTPSSTAINKLLSNISNLADKLDTQSRLLNDRLTWSITQQDVQQLAVEDTWILWKLAAIEEILSAANLNYEASLNLM